jgi:probable addiction module antidote protein
MPVQLAPWDSAEVLTTPERIAAYLEEMTSDGDARTIATALGAVARAGNLSALARRVGLTREGLRRALSGEGNPSLGTIVKVAEALGVHVVLKPAPKRAQARTRKPVPSLSTGGPVSKAKRRA